MVDCNFSEVSHNLFIKPSLVLHTLMFRFSVVQSIFFSTAKCGSQHAGKYHNINAVD